MRDAAVRFLCLAAVLTGCTTANVSGQGGSFVTTGTPQIGVNIQGSSVAGVVVTTAVFAALAGIWRDPLLRRYVPELLEGRAINEADCTQPIADLSKNLKCR